MTDHTELIEQTTAELDLLAQDMDLADDERLTCSRASDALEAQASEIARLNKQRIELQTERAALLERLAKCGVEARRAERERMAPEIEALRADAERNAGERAVFGRWIIEALPTLATLMNEDSEDGGEYLRTFIDRGQRLASAAMQGVKG